MTDKRNTLYNVIEDSGGGLLLTSFNDAGDPRSCCNPQPETLAQDIRALLEEGGDMSGWDNTREGSDAMEEYVSMLSCQHGWTIVCDQDGFRDVELHGNNACKAFDGFDHRGQPVNN